MTILSTDVKMFESERLTDEEDGGGRMTGNEIVDGEANNLFPDISRLDRVYGRVNLRKWFLGIDTDNTDTYYGSHTIIDRAPDDPNVSVVNFVTGSHTDERAAARQKIEAYSTAGPVTQMRLYGDQLVDQRSLRLWRDIDEPYPDVDEVYLLSVEDEGHPAAGTQQFVRFREISDIDGKTFQEQTNDGLVEFNAWVYTVALDQALTATFPGNQPTRDFALTATVVRETQSLATAKYYGIQPVTSALTSGDLEIPVASITVPIVPATKSEIAITDADIVETVTHEMQSNGTTVEVSGYSHQAITDVESRGETTFTKTLTPLPAAGTTAVEYRSEGEWRRLYDDGSGNLVGAGTGTIDYETGDAQITLEFAADQGSALLWSWGSTIHYIDRGGSTQGLPTPWIEIPFSSSAKPGTVTVSWEDAQGTAQSVTDDGAGGLSGDASGEIVYSGPERGIRLRPGTIPGPATTYTVDYDAGAANSESKTVPGGTPVTGTLGSTPVEAGSVAIRCPVTRQIDTSDPEGDQDTIVEYIRVIVDDGAGNLMLDGTNIGTITYSDGSYSFDPTVSYDRSIYYPSAGDAGVAYYETVSQTETVPANALVRADYTDGSTAFSTTSEAYDQVPVRFAFYRTAQERAAPGTLAFDFAGDSFAEVSGTLYRNPDSDNAVAGTFNRDTGKATLDDYPAGSPAFSVQTLVTQRADWTVQSLYFRTNGAPLKPLSLYVQATDTGGDLIDATADANGDLDATYLDGRVDEDTGLVRVDFGQMVDDDSLSTEEKNRPWYDSGNIDGSGQIFQPHNVRPGSASFNAVVLSSLPLDQDLLGLDPTLLPKDGRVPIYQRSGVVVVHNTQSDEMPSPLSAGQEVQLSRTDLALVYLEDDTGATVDQAQYVVDLAAGTVTMADPLDLSSYTEPLHAFHRIEDMLLVTNVRIDGLLTVNAGVTRDYPADTTYCSSAIVHGDLQARVTDFFAQASWDGVTWKDERDGDDTTASYNTAQYPIAVENQGAIKERWALEFTGTTTFNIVGESVGVIGTGDTSIVTAPTNPATGAPYWSIEPEGWGSGWQVGNVVRFNTQAATAPVWTARTILAGEATGDNDSFRIQNRGDAD